LNDKFKFIIKIIIHIFIRRFIHYALRDTVRGLGAIPVYRVETDDKIKRSSLLIPVRDHGFVIQLEAGSTLHSQGMPWWLLDMRPQGYMSRAYATGYAQVLG